MALSSAPSVASRGRTKLFPWMLSGGCPDAAGRRWCISSRKTCDEG